MGAVYQWCFWKYSISSDRLQVLPFRARVLRGLAHPLDDKKRLVRKEAVQARAEWWVTQCNTASTYSSHTLVQRFNTIQIRIRSLYYYWIKSIEWNLRCFSCLGFFLIMLKYNKVIIKYITKNSPKIKWNNKGKIKIVQCTNNRNTEVNCTGSPLISCVQFVPHIERRLYKQF